MAGAQPLESRPEFSQYTANHPHEIKQQYIMDRPTRAPGVRGYETLREDAYNPKHDQLAERHLNSFRTQWGADHHHVRPFEQAKEQWDGGKIVDKGRGKGSATMTHGINNPLTNTWVQPPTEVMQSTQRIQAGEPATLPRRWMENGGEHFTKGKATTNCTFGEYDPLRHQYISPPDAMHESARQREHDRVWSTIGIPHQVAPQGSYDPIRHEWVSPPTNGTSMDLSPKVRRKKAIYNGDTWGVHDPVRNEWLLKPESPKFQDDYAQSLRAEGRTGHGKAQVAMSRNTGVYDPIRNVWIVPPQNRRIQEGLSYHPRGLFKTYGRS